MIEGPENNFENHRSEREMKTARLIELVRELSESQVVFEFPGLYPDSYARLKADCEEFPDYAPPIDELLERFKNEGMKVSLGKYPESGNVFILPAQSDDLVSDSIFPRHLQIDENMDERLRELIVIQTELREQL